MSNLRIAEVDFDTIKQNLKTFLQAQDEFTDYDFEGSSLSILLDILAYNTHYNAYYANMLMNEMFLDSAVKRPSAVSIAKHLGYTPRSARCAVADIDITVTNPTGLPATLTLPRYTSFTSTINGVSYTFLNDVEYTATRSGTSYTFTDVEVKEGTLQEYTFTVSDASSASRYEIPSSSVDTTTLLVTVQNSATDTTTKTYTLATDITSLSGTSEIYFLEQSPLGKYELLFGDGVLGKKLSVGNLIKIQFITSSGKGANTSSLFSQSFTASGSIGGSNTISISVNSNSTGGADQETISEIKFNAPRVGAAKNRAVTSIDYEALIQASVTEAESISVWGGEDNEPPIYGKVLISLKPFEGYVISDNTKNIILNNILKTKKTTTVIPEFIDPDYLYARFNVRVTYNSNTTTLTPDGIKTLVSNGITTYFNTNLNKFNKSFYASQLSKYLMNLNSSIISVSLSVGLQVRLDPVLNTANEFVGDAKVKFYNKIHPNEIVSTNFYQSVSGVQTLVYLQDRADVNPPDYNGTGTLGLYNFATNRLITNVGTVNYGTGEVTITSITPSGYVAGQTTIQLSANLQEEYYNITTSKNQVLVLDASSVDTSAKRLSGVDIAVTSVVQ